MLSLTGIILGCITRAALILHLTLLKSYPSLSTSRNLVHVSSSNLSFVFELCRCRGRITSLPATNTLNFWKFSYLAFLGRTCTRWWVKDIWLGSYYFFCNSMMFMMFFSLIYLLPHALQFLSKARYERSLYFFNFHCNCKQYLYLHLWLLIFY